MVYNPFCGMKNPELVSLAQTAAFPDSLLVSLAQTATFADFLSVSNAQAAERSLSTGFGKPLHFLPLEALSGGQTYEGFIAQTGGVPTRDNFHDRYNAIMWLTAPKTKALLNRLQQEEILRLGIVTTRGPVRDALTLWDENLAVVVAQSNADLVTELLKRHDWQALFIAHRSKWKVDWQVRLFGHALMEKLHSPYKAITAHVLVIESDSSEWPLIDAILFQWLLTTTQLAALTPKVFCALPLMGIPGWCEENEDPEFYADAAVFRPARKKSAVVA
jgi:hypothetical protein